MADLFEGDRRVSDGDRRVSDGDRRVFDGDRRVVEADPAVLLAGQRAAVAVHLRQGAVAVALRIGEFGEVVGTAGQQRQRRSRGSQSQGRSEEHTSELQSLMRISYAVFCLKK